MAERPTNNQAPLGGIDPARSPLLFYVEFWPVARCQRRVGLNCANLATESAICAHFANRSRTERGAAWLFLSEGLSRSCAAVRRLCIENSIITDQPQFAKAPMAVSARKMRPNVRSPIWGPNPNFLLGGRTSASAECRHKSRTAVRWSSWMGCVQPHPNKLFFAGVRNEFRFVEDRRADYPVTIMCDVLGVSTAGYYAWRSRPESRRSVANRDLVNDIKRVHRDTSGRYGSFTLLRLPPYAPELNPIENVWEYLRGNYLGHIVWNTYEQIVEACCTAWNAFIHDTERVTSVTTRSWAKVTT
jgi:hypothetical protein